jgi:signal transduction histidine kinase
LQLTEHLWLQEWFNGEIGDMVQNSPEMQQQAQADPDGFKVLFDSMVAKRVAEITTQLAQEEAGGQKPDPLVALKQRELDLRAMDMQRKAQENMMDQERKVMEFEDRLDLDKMKLESAEDQAEERIRIAEEKIDLNREKQSESKQQKS